MNRILFAASLLSLSLFSAELKISGIVLTPEAADLEQYAEINGVVIHDLLFAATLDTELATQFLDQPLTSESLQQIKAAILKFYQSHDHPLVAVRIPEQEISMGRVICEVSEAKAGTVTFAGNRWFPNRIFQKVLPIQSGEPIDSTKILNGLAWLNRNPFHHTEVVISASNRKGASDIEFVTQDRFPVRVFAGVDNTGTEPTREIRLFGGVNCGNTFNIDDLLSFQYTTSQDFHRFMSYFASYTSFLPWKHTFTVFGAYARIHPRIENFTSSGTDIQLSGRYAVPFKPLYTDFLHEFSFGYDFKTYNNDLFFVEFSPGVPVINRKIELSQFYLGYKLNDIFRIRHDITFKAELFGSPAANWFPHQNKSAYGTLRPNASPIYIYGKAALGDIYTLPRDFKIAFLFRGQLSSGPLLPSEQFALGGYDTVRGYNELDFIVDNGVCLNLEIRSPSWQLFRKLQDRLFLLAFMDYGWGRNDQVELSLPNTSTLWSVGPGIRYTLLPYLNARLDYGFQLHHIFDDHRFGKFHFSVAASY